MIKGSNHCHSLNPCNCWNASKDLSGGSFWAHCVHCLPRQPHNGLNYHLSQERSPVDISGRDLPFDPKGRVASFFLDTSCSSGHLKTKLSIQHPLIRLFFYTSNLFPLSPSCPNEWKNHKSIRISSKPGILFSLHVHH